MSSRPILKAWVLRLALIVRASDSRRPLIDAKWLQRPHMRSTIMLAEIFMLRIEIMLRASNERAPVKSNAPFVPIKPSGDDRTTGR